MKDVGLLVDTSFATLLIRAAELIRSQNPSRKFDLQKIIMDDLSTVAQKDKAMGELFVTQGGYLTLQNAADFTSEGALNTGFPCMSLPSDIPVSSEEPAASKQLQRVCPVVATMKEAGLCDTSFATLLSRSKRLIESQHRSRAFNLHMKIVGERSTSTTKDAALTQLLVTHGGYFSLPLFYGNQTSWHAWKGQFPPGAPSTAPQPMQLCQKRAGARHSRHRWYS
jgi:hypothetical protein